MAITTVKDFAQNEKNNTQKALNAANTALAAAQSDLALAQTDRQSLATQIEQFKQTDDQLRAKLQAIPTPADANQITKDLGDNTIKMRGAQKKYTDAIARLDVVQRALVRAQAEVTRAAAADAQAAAQLAWATKDSVDNDSWRQAIKQPPLSTIPGSSATALSDANGPYKKADAKLANDVPAKLLQRAEDRGRAARNRPAVVRDRLQQIENLADDTIKTQTTSLLPQRRTAYRRSQQALRDYVANAPALYQRALDLLKPIPGAPGLTNDEKARVNDQNLAQARGDAVDKETDVGTALDAVDKAEWDLKLAELQVLVVDPDADVTQDNNWKQKNTDLGKAQQDVQTKKGAFTAAMQAALAEWELAVPDTTWQLVADFIEAEGILDTLKKIDPSDQTGLPNDLKKAETDYAAALDGDSKEQRSNQVVQSASADYSDRATAAGSAAPAAELSAVRGDA